MGRAQFSQARAWQNFPRALFEPELFIYKNCKIQAWACFELFGRLVEPLAWGLFTIKPKPKIRPGPSSPSPGSFHLYINLVEVSIGTNFLGGIFEQVFFLIKKSYLEEKPPKSFQIKIYELVGKRFVSEKKLKAPKFLGIGSGWLSPRCRRSNERRRLFEIMILFRKSFNLLGSKPRSLIRLTGLSCKANTVALYY